MNIKYIIFKVTVQQRAVFLLSIQVQLPHENKELSEEIYHIDENEQLVPNMFVSINNIVVLYLELMKWPMKKLITYGKNITIAPLSRIASITTSE